MRSTLTSRLAGWGNESGDEGNTVGPFTITGNFIVVGLMTVLSPGPPSDVSAVRWGPIGADALVKQGPTNVNLGTIRTQFWTRKDPTPGHSVLNVGPYTGGTPDLLWWCAWDVSGGERDDGPNGSVIGSTYPWSLVLNPLLDDPFRAFSVHGKFTTLLATLDHEQAFNSAHMGSATSFAGQTLSSETKPVDMSVDANEPTAVCRSGLVITAAGDLGGDVSGGYRQRQRILRRDFTGFGYE